MPQIFEAGGLTWLIKDILRLHLQHYYQMQETILKCIRHELHGVLSLDTLRNRYTSQHLLPLLQDLVCPVTETMRAFVLKLPLLYFEGFPHPAEYGIYEVLLYFLNSLVLCFYLCRRAYTDANSQP